MARLNEPKITGTFGNVTVYRMRGNLYQRAKSNLSSERVKTDPAFAPLRKFAAIMKSASPIASKVYQTLKKKDKKRFSFQFLTGKALKMLIEGLTTNDVRAIMKDLYGNIRSFTQTGLLQFSPLPESGLNENSNPIPVWDPRLQSPDQLRAGDP